MAVESRPSAELGFGEGHRLSGLLWTFLFCKSRGELGGQDRVGVPPRGLDLVTAQEESLISEERVGQQSLVGIGRCLTEVIVVVEIHGGRRHFHGTARPLHAEREPDRFLGLQAQRENVGANLANGAVAQQSPIFLVAHLWRAIEELHGWRMELHLHLGESLLHSLAVAQ